MEELRAYAFVCVCVYVSLCLCLYGFVCVSERAAVYLCVRTRSYVCRCVCMHVWAPLFECICTPTEYESKRERERILKEGLQKNTPRKR